jgi:hypothetical protein
MAWQLAAGGAVSFINFLIHAAVAALIMIATRHAAAATDDFHRFVQLTALLTVTIVALTCAHLVEISIWAAFYWLAGIDPADGIHVFEFAFENYTALGYGDAVPPPGQRLYGPITALNGLLLIGLSVFIIYEVMRMGEIEIGRVKRADE